MCEKCKEKQIEIMEKLVKQLSPIVIAAAHELDEIPMISNPDFVMLSTKEAVVKAMLNVAYSFFPTPQNLDEIREEILDVNEIVAETNDEMAEYLIQKIKQRKGMH